MTMRLGRGYGACGGTIMGVLRRETIYEAAYDDEAFAALPDLIRRACDARSVVMHFVDPDARHVSMAHTGHWTDDEVALYGSIADKDILQQASAAPTRINQFWKITDDLVSPVRLRNSEIWDRFYRPIGDDTRHVLGASFQTPWGVGAIGVHRGDLSTAFGDEALMAVQDVAPDLRRMLIIRSKLMLSVHRAADARAVLDRFSLAIFQVDGDGRILDRNAEAERLCAVAGDGLVRRGRLELSEPDTEPLRRAIRRAAQPMAPEASIVQLRSGVLSDWTLTLSPLTTSGPARVLVVVNGVSETEDQVRRLRILFKLSHAEASVAVSLAQGESASLIAAVRGVSEHTVRSQIKSLFLKTGCRRQGQLVALVANLPPILLR